MSRATIQFPVTFWPGGVLPDPYVEQAELSTGKDTRREWRVYPTGDFDVGRPLTDDEMREFAAARREGELSRFEEGESRVALSSIKTPVPWLIGGRAKQLLPREWVLRDLQTANLEEDSSLVEFLLKFGNLARGFEYMEQLLPDDLFEPQTGAYRHMKINGVTLEAGPDVPVLSDHMQVHSWGSVKLEDARWWLKTLRAMAGTLRQWSNGLPCSDAWLAERIAPESEEHCWKIFTEAMNYGLEQLPPFAVLATGITVPPQGPTDSERSPVATVDLFTAGCVQIYNLIASGRKINICANERCRRSRGFLVQFGGSTLPEGEEQYRSDAKYCTVACGISARQQRRRQR